MAVPYGLRPAKFPGMETISLPSAFAAVLPVRPEQVQNHAAAFAAVFQCAEREVFRTALRRMRNTPDAQEVCQESFLKAITHLHQFAGASDSPDAFRAWLRRIAENQSIDSIRRRHADKYVSLDAPAGDDGVHLAERMAADSPNPETQYARPQMRRLLADAIERLRPDLRAVSLLRDVLHYSTAETAGRLGISSAAVRLRLFRARRQLRERLRPMAQRPARGVNRERHGFAFPPQCSLPSCACGD